MAVGEDTETEAALVETSGVVDVNVLKRTADVAPQALEKDPSMDWPLEVIPLSTGRLVFFRK